MSDGWEADETPTVLAPQAQDIKLFGKWSTDDVQVSDISLTVSVMRHLVVLGSIAIKILIKYFFI